MKLNKIAMLLAGAWAQCLSIAPQSGVIHGAGVGNSPPELPFSGLTSGVYRIVAAITIDETYSGKTGVFDIAAGVAVTLPRATGSGAIYKFFVKTTVTSVGDKIQVANTDDVMQGGAYVGQDGGDTIVMFETGSTSDTVTLNGTTTGGIVGDTIEIQDIAAGMFSVKAFLSATGTEATPFSAAV